MNFMYSYCTSLIFIPDISKWNTDNVIDISFMFSHCSLLDNLPDISKWKAYNVMDMSFMLDIKQKICAICLMNVHP